MSIKSTSLSAVGDATETTIAGALQASRLARNEALALLERATGLARTTLIAHGERPLDLATLTHFTDLVERRLRGEPIPYLTGVREFYGRPFAVGPGVLIPRHETELLVDRVRACCASTGGEPRRMLDLGTGSGAIAITVALECPGVRVIATDLSHEALAIARANAVSLGAAVALLQGDWYAALDDPAMRFDVIASNPPYVAAEDHHLDEGDVRFEPRAALTDEADGLAALRTVIAGAPPRLRSGGALLVEHGFDQGGPVRALFGEAGFDKVLTCRDLAGLERVTGGTAP